MNQVGSVVQWFHPKKWTAKILDSSWLRTLLFFQEAASSDTASTPKACEIPTEMTCTRRIDDSKDRKLKYTESWTRNAVPSPIVLVHHISPHFTTFHHIPTWIDSETKLVWNLQLATGAARTDVAKRWNQWDSWPPKHPHTYPHTWPGSIATPEGGGCFDNRGLAFRPASYQGKHQEDKVLWQNFVLASAHSNQTWNSYRSLPSPCWSVRPALARELVPLKLPSMEAFRKISWPAAPRESPQDGTKSTADLKLTAKQSARACFGVATWPFRTSTGHDYQASEGCCGSVCRSSRSTAQMNPPVSQQSQSQGPGPDPPTCPERMSPQRHAPCTSSWSPHWDAQLEHNEATEVAGDLDTARHAYHPHNDEGWHPLAAVSSLQLDQVESSAAAPRRWKVCCLGNCSRPIVAPTEARSVVAMAHFHHKTVRLAAQRLPVA